ncbi:MAG: SDR family NAD(P)-dependent oxidoreductase [Bacteroidota bacterium]
MGLQFLARPDFLEFHLPETHHVLLTNDGSALTSELIQQLQAKGNRVVVLNLPGLTAPATGHVVQLSAHTDEAVKTAIESIQAKYGATGTFLHLHPHFEFQNGNFAQHFAVERPILKSLFLLAKYLQKSLTELGQQQRANFLTVTRMDGQLGQGKRGNVSVLGGGITGMVKCLNLEWPSVFCRAVDLQPELPVAQMASCILEELHDPDVMVVEVGRSEQGRNTTAVWSADGKENHPIQTTVTEDSVFLVSGGARGVTATCVIEMAKAFRCKFILLGRSDVSFEVPDFAKEESDESALKRLIMMDRKARGEKPSLPQVKRIFKNIIAKKEIDQTMASIESHGAKVAYLQGDVTNLSSFQAALQQQTTVFGKVTGIIHGAGRLADKYIQDKTETDFDNVLSVKLDGLLSLFGAVDIHSLDHLILFSSVAGFYGNVGQTDYAIANEILSKAAHLFKTNHPNTQVSAINWGAWDSGMVSGELKAQFEAAGVTLVNSEGGAAMLVNELNTDYSDQAQVIIGGTLPSATSHLGELQTHRIRRRLTLADNPFLMHHVIQGHPVLPVVNAVAWMAQTCDNLYPDFNIWQIEDAKLFKGIVFDSKQQEEYIVELKELEKNSERIVFETTVLSEGKKLPTYYYKATITLAHKNAMPSAPTFDHQISGQYTPKSGEHLYEDGWLFHGDHFQGIEQILDFTDKHIVLSCQASAIPKEVQGQFAVRSVNTFFADIQYQGMLVWVQQYMEGGKSLPLRTDRVRLYRPIPFGKSFRINISIEETTEFTMLANCTVYDEQGNVYMQTEGAAVTVSQQLVW